MQALHAARRPADALAVYAATRRRLVDELGAEPGAELQDVHRAVLRGDGSRTASDNAAGRRAQTAVAPAQLPMEVRGFTGRVDELRRLDAIAAAQNDNPTAVIISALSGTAGVGKTALAVHWAHGVAEHFPDGQLYANLRGFDPTAPAVTPAETLHGFLNALGIPRQSVPSHVEAQAALYRSLLSGRRMLILLDNVRDADQIRILLPGSPGVLVVVTSRNQLSSLVAAEGAYPVTLDLLTQDDARALLAGRLGAERLAAEPAAADELIAACARLPLALTIVAARAIQHPGFRLAELAEGLRASQGRLDAFGGGDSATDVRSVFSWSYDTLGADAARLFRLLGLHLGSDISLPAAASLIGAPIGPVRSLLAELSLAHLITEHSPGRYACHDLLRAYAAELTEALDTADDRQAARQRLFDHYLHTAHAAGRILDPYRWMDLAPGVPDSRVLPETVTDYAGAVAWLEAERPILLAVADHAARTGVQPHAWQLAESIAIFLERRGDWHEMLAMQQTALDAARRQPDPLVEASARRHLGRGLGVLNRYAEADEQYRQALDLADRAGHVAGQAHVHMNLANVASRRGDAPAALRHSRRALELFRSCDNDRGQGSALNNVGWCHAKLGEYQLCIEHCDQALVLEEKIGDAIGEAHTVDTLGYAYHHLGAYDRAIDYYRRALAAHREFRDRYHEATVLTHIADSHHAAGRPDLAAEAWHQALEILTDLHHPDAEQVRAKLVRR
jgi:tetratricopeptide (TPR) repeat protein